MMKHLTTLLLLMGLLLTSCSAASEPTAAPEIAQAETATAIPPTATPAPATATTVPATNTPTPIPPTDTPIPATATNTATPVPTDTSTPIPTDTPTPAPTDTPTATFTPAPPTNTPKPTVPPATATPAMSAAKHYEQAVRYFKDDKNKEAIAELEMAVAAEADFSLAYYSLGYAYADEKEYQKSLDAFEKYLTLVKPDDKYRAEVTTNVEKLKNMIANPPPKYDVPEGKALFVFINYTDVDWNVDIGSYFLQVPARKAGEDKVVATIAIDPGTYTWQAQSPGGGYYITDNNNNHSFEFSVNAGDIYTQGAGN